MNTNNPPSFNDVFDPPLNVKIESIEAEPCLIFPKEDVVIPPESLNDFWRGVYPEGMNIQQVKNELSDLEMLIDNTTKVYSHITGGLVSKPNTDASVVISLSDDYTTETVEESVKELLDLISDVYNIPRYELEDCK